MLFHISYSSLNGFCRMRIHSIRNRIGQAGNHSRLFKPFGMVTCSGLVQCILYSSSGVSPTGHDRILTEVTRDPVSRLTPHPLPPPTTPPPPHLFTDTRPRPTGEGGGTVVEGARLFEATVKFSQTPPDSAEVRQAPPDAPMSEQATPNRRSARRSTPPPRVEVGEPLPPDIAARLAGTALSIGGTVEVAEDTITMVPPRATAQPPPATTDTTAVPNDVAAEEMSSDAATAPVYTDRAPDAVADGAVGEAMPASVLARVNAAQKAASKARLPSPFLLRHALPPSVLVAWLVVRMPVVLASRAGELAATAPVGEGEGEGEAEGDEV